MTELITIFIDGGEYVNRAAYIDLRDEASKLRERIEQLETALRENGKAFGIYGDHVRQAGCYAIADGE